MSKIDQPNEPSAAPPRSAQGGKAETSSYFDYLHMLRSWATNPFGIGAIAPSGEALGRLMTKEIVPGDGPIIELGPGTGVFTRALLNRGVPESDLTLIEFDANFAKILQRRFPKARILLADASKLEGQNLFPDPSVSAVISGLPLLSFPKDKVTAILSGSFSYLRPTANFYQFTYGPRCPVPREILQKTGLEAKRIGTTVRNLPPAFAFRITRQTTK